ncbi:MAG: trehalase family glycosidase [Acidobacteriaceae bacterium]
MYPIELVLLFLLIFGVSVFSFGETSPESFERVSVGAFDPDAWNGVVFDARAYGQPLVFAIRVGSKSHNFLDGERIFDAVSEVGPHAPDGSYALMGWRHYPRTAMVTLEWSRIDNTTVVGKLKAPADIQLVLEAYSPYTDDFTGAYHIGADGTEIIGDHPIDAHFNSAAHFIVATDRPVTGNGRFSSVAQLRKVMDAGQLLSTGNQSRNDDSRPQPSSWEDHLSGAAGLQFVTDGSSTAHFVAAIGWQVPELSDEARQLLQPGKIDAILDEKAAAYQNRRPHIQGLFDGAPEAIGNSMFWNTLYVPALGLEFPSISRHWAKMFGGWVVGEWDCFFGSLLTNVEDTAQTSASVRAILLSQSANGVVPNIDGGSGTSPDRSQPPVGSYAMWKNYERNQDREILEWAYPRLKLWHEWWFRNRGDGQPWRDGNRDGLLEWGSDKGSTPAVGGRGQLQAAKWESGMDDSPMWDDVTYNPSTYTMELDDVGLNSLYALDSECLAKIAHILGDDEDRSRFTADYERIKAAMREKLWNEKDGIYENRYWDGRFSSRLSPTNFYPMLAGVATPDQARRMVEEHLLNSKEFWGTYVVPTIARNDAVFQDQFYWRGDIWAPTNYLVYEGLNRYGEDDVALTFAEKSYDLFMTDWRANQHTNEQYYAWGGSAGGDKHYTWGALLCLIATEQYIDETPWDGFRFGSLNPTDSGELSNVIWNHHRYDIAIGPDHTKMARDRDVRFEATGGIIVRNYALDSRGLSFSVKAMRSVTITTRERPSGTLSLKVDDQAARSVEVQHGSISFTVPAGRHLVAETWVGAP